MTSDPKQLLQKARQKAIHQNLAKWTSRVRINVGMSTCEIAAGSKEVWQVLHDEVKRRKLKDVYIGQKGCIGRCHLEPTVEVFVAGKMPFRYENVDVKKAKQIITDHLVNNKDHSHGPVDNHDYVSKDSLVDKSRYIFGDLTYFKKQTRVVLRNCGVVDPESIDDYLAVRGYEALAKVLSDYTPARIIDEVTKSGLRGRGGGGFPTGIKWKFVAEQKSDEKYVICNADEGDPGAFMDRSTIEGDPFSIIEAMTIGGYAVGANKGIVYIRAEYPLAVERLQIAIDKAKKLNLLGKNILGSNFSFDISIVLGAGAFVCGEETALINSIQGERGMPRIRPPYPPVKGLWGKPTLINNVETWANIPVIILDGYNSLASIGTDKSKGTKVFALAGKVLNTGLVEVPMGTSLGEVIFDIGGGVKNGKKFKTAQTGGPSGGCLPTQYLNTSVDYESLTRAGSIMGSGGLIVMDETDCMVDVARFFLEFTQDESCGKCTPCREGTKRMLEILNRIAKGEGKIEDLTKLEELGETIKKTALCGLGQTAPNPVLSTLRYFKDEYLAHIQERRCPAVVCGDLFVSPCQHTCPVHIDIPGYIGLIREGKIKESLGLIMERNPFPSICGRVCHHPCESNCRRGKVDENISIMRLKRFSADIADKYKLKLNTYKGAPKKDKVAIVGSGPAGLSCAFRLTELGYSVVVFESEKVAGGMLSLGIPEYRLPQKIVQRDIERIKRAGVVIKTDVTVGKDITLSQLREEGYKAIFLGMGLWKEKNIVMPGIDLPQVLGSLKFLKSVKTGKVKKYKDKYVLTEGNKSIVFSGKKVAVIGGGNAAIDVARTALRLGASGVEIIYRRTKEAMPAIAEEIHDAEKEGVKFNFLVNPTAILGSNGNVSAIECARMNLGEFDLSSRRKAQPTQELVTISTDIVVFAIGAEPDFTSMLSKSLGIESTGSGTIKTDSLTFATNVKGVFAGGDAVSGGATVVEAIAQGEQAAISIDRFLSGKDLTSDRFIIKGKRKYVSYIDPTVEVKPATVTLPKNIAASKRIKCFDEAEAVYSSGQAFQEADRCLRCDRMEEEVRV